MIGGMGKAVVVYNPVAGSASGSAIAGRANRHLQASGWEVRVIPTRDRSGATGIAAEVAADVDLLVVVGGDGTLREAIEGLGEARQRVRLGFLPVGNANVAAQELGIPLDSDQAIELLDGGETATIDLGVLRTGGSSRLFLAMIGIGWDAMAVHYVDRVRHSKLGGRWYRLWADSVYLICGLLALLRRGPRALEIEVDGEPLEPHFRAIHVSNFRTYGKAMYVTPDAHHQSGRLHYQARRRVAWPALAWHLVAASSGRHAPEWISSYGEGSRVRIVSPTPIPIQVDGDAHPPVEELEAEILPGGARIIVPAS
jgi:diacylglycerol kinase (ATP)